MEQLIINLIYLHSFQLSVKIAVFSGKDACIIIATDDITILTPLSQPDKVEYLDFRLEIEDAQIIDETAAVNPVSNTEAIEKL